MTSLSKGRIAAFLILTVVGALSCSNPVADRVLEDVLVANAGGRPVVTSFSPAAGATEVDGDEAITISFEGDMDPSSINEDTLVVSSDGTPIAGIVNYDEDTRVASFIPSNDYPRAAAVNVELADEARNIGGASLSEPLEFEFTTAEVYNYEIRVAIAPGSESITSSSPLYVFAANVSTISTGITEALGAIKLDSLDTTTERYLDLRDDFAPSTDYWVVLHWDLNNSVADGTDAANFDPDVAVPGFLEEGFNGQPHFIDPSDHGAFYTQQSPSGTVSFDTMGFINNVDRYTENPDAGNATNPDMAVRGGESLSLSLVPQLTVSGASSDVAELSVSGTPSEIDVDQYGLYWFRFTPDAGFVPSRLTLADSGTGEPAVYVKADLWNDNPITGSPTDDRSFYSPNESETDFGFWSSNAELDYSFTAGTEYYLRVQIVHIVSSDGRFLSNAPLRVRFFD